MTSAPLPSRRSDQLETEAAARVGGLFERHGRMVYGVCRVMLRDVHEAEDAAQQVFLSAHKALLGGVRVRDSGGWLATIARNECRGRIAAGMRAPLPIGDEDLEAIPSTVDEQARHEQALEFQEALAALPERQREAVVLRYLYGLRYGEVATALGLSRPATEALLFRAHRALRGRLRPVVGTVLVVPLALREELARAIPGFSVGPGTSAVAAGAAGGLLAKLTATPVGVKVATAAVAVSTVGAVGAVETERPIRGEREGAPVVRLSDGLSSAESPSAASELHFGGDRDRRGSDEVGGGPAREAHHGDAESTGTDESERRGSNATERDGLPELERAESSGTGSEIREVEDRSGRSGSPTESRSSGSSDSDDAGSSHSDDSGDSSDRTSSSGSGASGSGDEPDDESSGPGSGSEDDPEADDAPDEAEDP